MTRTLPVSDVTVSGWSSTAASLWQAVAKLVPDACPGTDYISHSGIGSGWSDFFKLGLGSLAASPRSCTAKLWLNSTIAGGMVSVDIFQGTDNIFTSTQKSIPATGGSELDIPLEFLMVPAALTNWSVQVSVDTGTAGGGLVKFWGVELDFSTDGGGSGPGGQLGQNATFLLLLMDNEE